MADPNDKVPKPIKRSFFKKSSWQTETEKSQDKDDPTHLFSRASESFKEIIAEEEQRRHKQEKRHRDNLEEQQLDAEASGKKSKTTDRVPHAFPKNTLRSQADSLSPSRRSAASTLSLSPQARPKGLPPAASPARYIETSSKPRLVTHKNIISLDDCEDSDGAPVLSHVTVERGQHGEDTARLTSPNHPSDSFDGGVLGRTRAEDEHTRLPNLNEELHETAHGKVNTGTGDNMDTARADLPDRSGSLAKPASPEPVVDVLITCRMPGFQEQLVIKIPYSMRFGVVRQEWCKHQDLPPEVEKTIILTYKNKRIWNSTSSRSIGITPDNIDYRGGPMLEATTEQILAEAKQREMKALQAKRAADEDFEDAPAKPPAPKFKLTLKSKGFADFKLQVHSDSTFERIAAAFRKSRNVAKDKAITIMFDGDIMSPQTKISDTDIEDPECLDVYVK